MCSVRTWGPRWHFFYGYGSRNAPSGHNVSRVDVGEPRPGRAVSGLVHQSPTRDRKEGRGDAADLVSTSPTRVFACVLTSDERMQSAILTAGEEADVQRGRHSGCPRSCHSTLTSFTLVSWGQGKGQGTRGAVALTTLRVVWEGVPWAGCDFPGNPQPTLQAKQAWSGTQPSQRPACVGVTHVPETSELSPRWHFRSLQRLSVGR